MSLDTEMMASQAGPATQLVVDTAYNLLNAPAAAYACVRTVTLIGSPTLSCGHLARLERLPGFNVDPSARIRLADSLANINAVLAAKPAWFSAIGILDLQLEGNGIGESLAGRLVDLERQGLNVVFTPSTRGALTRGAPASVITATVPQLEALAELRLADTTIAIRDSAAAISADLALRGGSAIVALLPHIDTIDVSDHGAIILTANQALSGGIDDDAQSALALSHGGSFAVTHATVAQIAQLDRLPVPPAAIDVIDTTEAVIAGTATLRAFGGRLRVTLTDAWITAAQVPPLTQVRALLTSGVPVHDTAQQIATLAKGDDAASIAYLNVYGARLCADGIAALADIEALSWLTRFSKNGHRLHVWDDASELTARGAAAILSARWVDGIFLRTEAGAAKLSAAQAAALFGMAGFSSANPDGSANTITIAEADTAIAPWASEAKTIRASGGNETVDACTILRLSDGIFISGGNRLARAGNDLTDAVALRAIAGSSAPPYRGAPDISLAAGALALDPPEFASLRTDADPPSEHIVAAVLFSTGVTDATMEQQRDPAVTAPDTGEGPTVSLPKSVSGREGQPPLPVVVLGAGPQAAAVAKDEIGVRKAS
jgi:hypothetical protein